MEELRFRSAPLYLFARLSFGAATPVLSFNPPAATTLFHLLFAGLFFFPRPRPPGRGKKKRPAKRRWNRVVAAGGSKLRTGVAAPKESRAKRERKPGRGQRELLDPLHYCLLLAH